MSEASPIKFKVDPGDTLRSAIRHALTQVRDLTIPYKLIANDWFQSNNAIFSLGGPGKYVDLSEKYKVNKKRSVGFIYPILKHSGLLEKSLTDPSDGNSINLIINGDTLVLGTKVPYAPAHQFGTSRLPVRPVIFTNGEQSASDDRFNRSTQWSKILYDYVLQASKDIGRAA